MIEPAAFFKGQYEDGVVLSTCAGIAFKQPWRITGDGCAVLEIKGTPVVIDEMDLPLVVRWCWHLDGGGYARRSSHGRTFFLHHVIVGREPGKYTDHINGVRTDNRRKNLRVVTRVENNRNSAKKRSRPDLPPVSQFIGVHKNPAGQWVAAIRDGGRQRKVICRTEEGAARVRDALAVDSFGAMARLNFPIENR